MIQVPVDRFRPIVERWVADFDTPEQAYRLLATATGLSKDTWRKRFTELVQVGPRGTWRGWWSYTHLDEGDVDEFLSAAGLTYIWQTELVDLIPARPKLRTVGKPKRRGVPCRIPDTDLYKMNRLHHGTDRLSINAIAKQVYTKYGYKTHGTCANAISSGWRRLELSARDRVEMTVACSRTSGLSPRDHRKRYALRRAAGLTNKGKPPQPLCVQEGCKRKRMFGGLYCDTHHPDRVDARLALLADMRSRSPKHNPDNLTTVAAIQPSLRSYWATFGTWKPLERAGGPSNATLRRYLIAEPDAKIMRDTVTRILGAIGSLERVAA